MLEVVPLAKAVLALLRRRLEIWRVRRQYRKRFGVDPWPVLGLPPVCLTPPARPRVFRPWHPERLACHRVVRLSSEHWLSLLALSQTHSGTDEPTVYVLASDLACYAVGECGD